MAKSSGRLTNALIALTALSVILCPLAWGSSSLVQSARAAQPFPTVRPQDGSFPTPFGASEPIPTPLPTLGPDQYFEETDSNRPEVHDIEKGDELFGYGPLEDDPDLYLMWHTDEDGTHYRTVAKDSDVLFGTIDPDTHERRDDGFDQLIKDRDPLLDQLEDLNNLIDGKAKSRDGRFTVGGMLLGFGIGFCIAATGGACAVVLGITIPAALGFGGAGLDASTDRANLIEQRDTLNGRIDDVEEKLSSHFDRPEPEPTDT